MRGDGGVAGEERVVGIPKFHSWGKCTIPLTNINSDWICPTLPLACVLYWVIILFTRVLKVASWGVTWGVITSKCYIRLANPRR